MEGGGRRVEGLLSQGCIWRPAIGDRVWFMLCGLWFVVCGFWFVVVIVMLCAEEEEERIAEEERRRRAKVESKREASLRLLEMQRLQTEEMQRAHREAILKKRKVGIFPLPLLLLPQQPPI